MCIPTASAISAETSGQIITGGQYLLHRLIYLLNKKILRQKKSLTSRKTHEAKKPASTYSPTLKRAVPSAQVGLTSLFEMVRGGPNRHRHRKPLSQPMPELVEGGGGALMFCVKKSNIIEVVSKICNKSTGN